MESWSPWSPFGSRLGMERLSQESCMLIIEFLGEPDSTDSPSNINAYMLQIFEFCYVSRFFLHLYLHWYDNEMDCAFHH